MIFMNVRRQLIRSFPWLKTAACCDACANLKGAFLTAVLIIIVTMTVTMLLADEKHHVVNAASAHGCISVFADLFKTLKNMPPSMFKVLAVTFVTWVPTSAPHACIMS